MNYRNPHIKNIQFTRYQKLFIKSCCQGVKPCIEMIEADLSNGWTRDLEKEKEDAFTSITPKYCFRLKKELSDSPCLWLRYELGGNMIVSVDITQENNQKLDFEKYNDLLDHFAKSAFPLKKKLFEWFIS